MTELLTSAQMRAIETAAIDSGDVTGLELMERAGQGVVDAILAEWPELARTTHRAVVLCGPGNNGGDGFVVARLLQQRGWETEVLLYGEPAKLPPDAKANWKRWSALGRVRDWPRPGTDVDFRRPDIIVDALFGTGLSRPLSGDGGFADMLPDRGRKSHGDRPKVVAVDIPSGLCSDSGRTLGGSDCLWAHLTVTFHRAKLGHYLGKGEALCGKIVVADIGLDGRTIGANVVRLADPDREGLGRRARDGVDGHKYTHGHALILSGPPGRTGAARLAARGALRIGAGLVTLGVPPAAQLECAARLTSIMLTRVRDADALAATLEDNRLNALCIGPGFGTGDREAAILATALGVERAAPGPRGGRDARPVGAERAAPGGAAGRDIDAGPDAPTPTARDTPLNPDPDRPVEDRATPSRAPGAALSPHRPRNGALRPAVLDADALTILADNPDLFDALHDGCILTPHAGEFRRLFPDIAAHLDAPATTGPAYSKVDATRDAAKRAGCTVLFKGAATVIADPSGRAAINASTYDRAAPWLATAGSGDVLAGFIAGLLARGFPPFDAASTAAWLHTECARAFGPGLIAEDIPEELPKVFRHLGL